MTPYTLEYSDCLERKKKASSEFFFPGHHILHTETEELEALKGSNGAEITNLKVEHNFTCYRGSQIMSWHVMNHDEKKNAQLKTRFLCHETDLLLSKKIHAYMEAFACSKGWKCIIVISTPSGIGFYRSLGFEYESASLSATGIVFYMMKKGI